MMKKEGYPYFHPHRVRYSEIDLQGIVYNSRYLDYFDAAITEYMRHCGFNYVTDARNTGKDFHLVKASVEFLKPVPYCLLYTSPSPRDRTRTRMPSSA